MMIRCAVCGRQSVMDEPEKRWIGRHDGWEWSRWKFTCLKCGFVDWRYTVVPHTKSGRSTLRPYRNGSEKARSKKRITAVTAPRIQEEQPAIRDLIRMFGAKD